MAGVREIASFSQNNEYSSHIQNMPCLMLFTYFYQHAQNPLI